MEVRERWSAMKKLKMWRKIKLIEIIESKAIGKYYHLVKLEVKKD